MSLFYGRFQLACWWRMCSTLFPLNFIPIVKYWVQDSQHVIPTRCSPFWIPNIVLSPHNAFHRFRVLFLQVSRSFSLLVVVSHSIFFVLSEWYSTCTLQVYANAMLAQYVFLKYLAVIDTGYLSCWEGWMLDRDSAPWPRHQYDLVALARVAGKRCHHSRLVGSCS